MRGIGSIACVAAGLAIAVAAPQPGEVLEALPPAHLAAWQTAWSTARACLVGEPQAARELVVAVPITRLAQPTTSCAPLVKAARDAALAGHADAGYRLAWYRVTKPLTELVRNESSLDPRERYPQHSIEALIADAVGDVDLADRILHELARVTPPSRAITTPQPPVLFVKTIVAGTESADAVVPLMTEGAEMRLGLSNITTMYARVIADGPDRAYINRRREKRVWDARTNNAGTEIVVGNVGPDDKLVASKVIMRGRDLGVLELLQDGDARAIVIHAGASLSGAITIVRSADGTSWDRPVSLGTAMALRRAGTVHLFSRTRDEVRWQRVLGPRELPPAIAFSGPGLDPENTCVLDNVLWWWANGRGFVVDERGVRWVGPATAIRACSATAAAFATAEGALAACTRERCAAPESFPERSDAAFDDAGGLVVASVARRALLVTQGKVKRAYELPNDSTIAGVAVWQGKVHVGLFIKKFGVSVVPLP